MKKAINSDRTMIIVSILGAIMFGLITIQAHKDTTSNSDVFFALLTVACLYIATTFGLNKLAAGINEDKETLKK